MKILVSLLTVALLLGCSPPRTAPAPAEAAPQVQEDPSIRPPTIPDWAQLLIGQNIAEAFPNRPTTCIGNTESVVDRSSDGAHLVGWAWDDGGHAGYLKFIVADAAGVINGAGDTTYDRPDVPPVRSEVTSAAHVGYDLSTIAKSGPVTIYGVDVFHHAACQVGVITL